MKMVLVSSVAAIAIAVVAYVILVNTGMDTASVYSGKDVRVERLCVDRTGGGGRAASVMPVTAPPPPMKHSRK